VQDAADQRPILTMPDVEAVALAELYEQADVILEYGSGGSTVLASEMAGKRILSVESDAAWLARMQAWFDASPPASPPVLHHADIGPTKPWGFPASLTTFRRWPGYAQSVWDRPDFVAPDVVLVDGRFRLACILTVALRIDRATVLLVDDYIDRAGYHVCEPMLGPPTMIGRMARFDLVPGLIPMNKLSLIIDSHLRPN